MSVMEHLFKFLLLAPYFYFDNWIEKANRNSKFFQFFIIFTGFTSPSILFLALLGQLFQFCFSIPS
ncbi:Uncharacterised protein [Streptococcus pneumoniae]|nr:Uncharacterised protein [Streptococcus pneumoniae]VME57502.1 Uncharacterised protein [Streptococcus pneumoniae]VNL06607.1 Uncharacterised protein [Streptococcus pneumoniae]